MDVGIQPEMRQASVLVVCSDKTKDNNKDYYRGIDVVETTLNQLGLITEYTFWGGEPSFPKEFYNRDKPDNANLKFDVIWFAGCNLIKWIHFKSKYPIIDILKKHLKRPGFVIFTETPKYILNYINNLHTSRRNIERFKTPSIRFDGMKYTIGILTDEESEDKRTLTKTWNDTFTLITNTPLWVYKIHDNL